MQVGFLGLGNLGKEIAKTCDPIFVIVFDSKASREVIFGEKGLLQGNLFYLSKLLKEEGEVSFMASLAKELYGLTRKKGPWFP